MTNYEDLDEKYPLMAKSWHNAQVSAEKVHLCNCVGCCKECGMCVTNPQHTSDVCRQLVVLNILKSAIINGRVNLMPRPTT
jgi:hypothetical protein